MNLQPNVLFGDHEREPGFVRFVSHLSESDWQHWIVGMTSLGLLYVDRQKGSGDTARYEAKHLGWDEIVHVDIRRHFSFWGMVGGLVLMSVGCSAVKSMSTDGTESIAAIFPWLSLFPFAGFVLIAGPLRNQIVVKVQGRVMPLTWTSAPLCLRSSRPFCEELYARCRTNRVSCKSSLSPEPPLAELPIEPPSTGNLPSP